MLSLKRNTAAIDVLMIDDITVFKLERKAHRRMIFHTFNYLYETGKQVIITSDKPPKDFTNLEERLRSRFSVGLPVDVSAPDYETRVAILHKKEETENTKISDDIINYIAEISILIFVSLKVRSIELPLLNVFLIKKSRLIWRKMLLRRHHQQPTKRLRLLFL